MRGTPWRVKCALTQAYRDERDLSASVFAGGAIAIGLGLAGHLCSQTASTGALTGIALDPSDAALPEVTLQLVSQKGGEVKFATSDDGGRFSFLLLPPGTYELEAKKADSNL